MSIKDKDKAELALQLCLVWLGKRGSCEEDVSCAIYEKAVSTVDALQQRQKDIDAQKAVEELAEKD